jgi:4-amino-4-deoxy-L-arabinose transferase-like glycosyltransferase
MSWRQFSRWGSVGIVALALGIRLAWVLAVPNAQYSDSVWYDNAAQHLVTIGEYSVDPNRMSASGMYGIQGPSAWFPPGYPFFLAAIYKVVGYSQLAGKLGNVAVGGAIVWFTYLLGRRLVSAWAGLLAALLVAVWPNLVFQTGVLSSDLLCAAGFVAAMWVAAFHVTSTRARWVRAVVLGLLIGWMALVRPVSVILLPAIGLAWWIRGRSFRHALLLLIPVGLISAMPVLGWTARNYARFGQLIPIATNGGYNFWQVNHRYADGSDMYWRVVPMDDPEYRTMSMGNEFVKNREGYRYGMAYFSAHPDRFFTLIPAKLFWLYHTDTTGLYEGVLNAPMLGPSPLAAWIMARGHTFESLTFRYYEFLMGLAVIGAMGALVLRQWTLWPVTAIPLLLTFFQMFFHNKDRFHIPLSPFIAILAAAAVMFIGARLWQAWRQFRHGTPRTRGLPGKLRLGGEAGLG